ncbi:non-ribosomal peptide synthetase [Paraburkholderia phymatum]|uniref:Amino acid adenylation domain protein n=1 Tax=Paraburkholderia phymatum (strain DSM 17167 / CIP 108236 / LMG 21445 / STM815) TaxID=391038 RepID=B2JPH0_PARP8|nr:non-ribosomal peptide synthetase [Paraburkholderia phymatum]ACC73161.1 amino acid adenylation domain protein [Paraburkholderia phymatum STM815]
MKSTPDLLALAARFAQLPDAQRKLFITKLGEAGIDFRMLPIAARADRSSAVPASFAQTRLWLHARMIDEPAAYHVTSRLRLDGELNRAVLRHAFDALVARHEALRTTFVDSADGGVDQIVHAPSRCPWRFTDLLRVAKADRENIAADVAAKDEDQPFDLASDAPVRVHLIALDNTVHWLVLTMHHIVSDGWSIDVLLDELAAFYRAYANGKTVAPAPLPIQYADFSLWQRRWLDAGEAERQLQFWRERVKRDAGVLALPGSGARPMQRSARGGRHYFTIDAASAQRVRALAQARHATPFAVLLAALHALLARASGETHIQIGVPAANRERAETAGLIGFFVNTLVVGARVDMREPFDALIDQVQRALVDGQSNQDVPFEQIVEMLGVPRSASHHPLFQVMASYAARRAIPAFDNVRVTDLPFGAPYAKFDLTLGFEEREDGALDAAFVYSADLFDARAVQRIADEYGQLLDSALASSQAPVGDLEWLTEAELAQLDAWNAYRPASAAFVPVHMKLAQHAKKEPDVSAVTDAGRTLTRAELDARAARLAARMMTAGVGAEVRVGIAVGRTTDLFVGLLAILKSGGAFVPLDPTHPQERLAHIVDDALIEHVVTERRHLPKLPLRHGTRVWLIDADDAQQEEIAWHEPAIAPTQAAYLIYTSGSTGKPKGVVVDHASIAMHCAAIVARYGMCEQDRVLHFMSINFDGAHECWLAPLSAGVAVRITDDALWPPAQTCETIARERITIAAFTPSYALQMAEWARRHGAPRSLRSLTVGGEATSREAFAALRQAFPDVRVVNGYGPTETVITPLLWIIDAHEDASDIADAAYLPIGTPVGERTAHVLDANLRALPIGVTGELYLGGTGVARGYHARAALTAERFVPDPFGAPGARLYRTGDRVRRRANGVLEFVGRIDHQVKVRGLRIELGEIEARLIAHDDVRDAVAVVRGSGADAALAAYVELSEEAGKRSRRVDGGALVDYLRRVLPDYMVPPHIVVLDALPRNANRKIDRAALPEPLRTERAVDAPAPGIETALAKIWGEVLRVERVGRADHFFELGGHSLAAVSVATRVSERLSHDVAVRTLFEAPTLAAYAKRVAESPHVAADESTRHAQEQGDASDLALSDAQRALWFLWRAQPDSAAYNIPVALRLRGALDASALQYAFDHAASKHPALRARLVATKDAAEPRQTIGEHCRVMLPVVDLGELASMDERIAAAARLTNDDALAPFDLANGPLWRARVMRLADDDHVLSIVIHHIIADGRSIDVWLNDVQRAYAASVTGQPLNASTMAPAFAARTPVRQADMTFWRDALRGVDVLHLPQASAARPVSPAWSAGRIAFALDAPSIERVKALAVSTQATLPMVLHAGLNVALARQIGALDQPVGVLASTRDADADDAIGLFINAVVVRTAMRESASPRDVIAAVRDAALGAYAHVAVPFAQVVHAVRASRTASGNPLFKVMFNYLRAAHGDSREWHGIAVEEFNDVRHRVVFDLELDIVEHPDGRVTGAFSYGRELVDGAFVERLCGDYLAVVTRFVDAPDEAIVVSAEGPTVAPVKKADALREPSPRAARLMQIFARTWERTFEREAPAMNDNLFEAGTTSFDVVRFVDAANAAGYRIAIDDVFVHQTLSALAGELARRLDADLEWEARETATEVRDAR